VLLKGHLQEFLTIYSLNIGDKFCIANPIQFLNYPNHFYVFFLSCTFASGILFYFLLFLSTSTFFIEDTHRPKPRNFRAFSRVP
jgi:hypothetical protein